MTNDASSVVGQDITGQEACMAEQLKCGACGSTFGSKKEMEDHAKESHPKK